MFAPLKRTRAITAATACLVLGASSLAIAAEETTVSTQVTDPGRQLEVLDLSGNPLEQLHLQHERPETFEVRVTDSDQDPNDDFQVATTMTNLHLVEGESHVADHLGSENVSLSFPGNPLGATGLSVNLEPRYLVSTSGQITCATSTLACDLLGGLGDVLGLLGFGTNDDAIEFSGVELVGSLIENIDLDALGLSELPLGIGQGEGGPYTSPECSVGIGSNFCEGTSTATARQAMNGTPNDVAGDLLTALTNELGDLNGDLVGENGIFALDDVLTTLVGSDADLLDADGAVLGTVSDLGKALVDDMTAQEQTDVLNDILTATLEDLQLSDLLQLNGRYSSYPALTVNTDDAAGGAYEGTLVVTLIE